MKATILTIILSFVGFAVIEIAFIFAESNEINDYHYERITNKNQNEKRKSEQCRKFKENFTE